MEYSKLQKELVLTELEQSVKKEESIQSDVQNDIYEEMPQYELIEEKEEVYEDNFSADELIGDTQYNQWENDEYQTKYFTDESDWEDEWSDTYYEDEQNDTWKQSAIPDDTKKNEIIQEHIEIPKDFTAIEGLNPDLLDGLDCYSTLEDCKRVFGDHIYSFENAHPTSFSTSEDEDMTMFILQDGSKILLGWNEDGMICDYVYFYPLVKKYNILSAR